MYKITQPDKHNERFPTRFYFFFYLQFLHNFVLWKKIFVVLIFTLNWKKN